MDRFLDEVKREFKARFDWRVLLLQTILAAPLRLSEPAR